MICKQVLAPYKRGVAGSNPVAPTRKTKRSPQFRATYGAIATIAIARKLLTRAYHLLATANPPADQKEGRQTPGALGPAA